MSSGFITESALEEKRKKRQEEWEAVRKPEDPVEAPEEEYDGRCLYDRLKEQKDKKQEEWDEAHKLKNLVRGLDDDEVGFLDVCDRVKLAEEHRIWKEEKEELEEYRRAVAERFEQSAEERLRLEAAVPPAGSSAKASANTVPSIGALGRSSQSRMLAGIVKRKSTDNGAVHDNKKPKTGDTVAAPVEPTKPTKTALPGICSYSDSSSDEGE